MVLAAAALVLASAGLFWWYNTRATVLAVRAELPADFPEQGFSHAAFERLITRFVRGGRVDYQAWHSDREARGELDRYLAAIARFSPDNAPARFPSDADRLAYWMYAYNAFVIKAVLEHWPLTTVTEVKAPVELVKGLGFFYTLELVAGGERFSLYRLEHEKVIGPSRDPRAHFVLNCGSASCPILRPELPTGDQLEPHLARAASEFVSDPRNVAVDHARRRIELSRIFEWYRDDFVAELRRRSLPTSEGVVGYVKLVAPEPLRQELERAERYEVVYRPYDWGINRAESAATGGSGGEK